MKNIFSVLILLLFSSISAQSVFEEPMFIRDSAVEAADLETEDLEVLLRVKQPGTRDGEVRVISIDSLRSSGGGGGTNNHNALTHLQGGKPGEYYHLDSLQHDKLLDLIYVNNSATISITPSSAERGFNTGLTLSYTINANDDVFGTASINQGIGDVTSDIDGNAHTFSVGTSNNNKSYILTLNYTRKGQSETETKIATFSTYIPQWAGWSSEDDFLNDYAAISAETNLQKFVQSSAAINKVTSPSAQYVWFISNKNNAVIRDQNDFVQTVGTWGDGTSEFYRKSLNLTLSDGVTSATVYLYRSRNIKTLSNFTYKIQ